MEQVRKKQKQEQKKKERKKERNEKTEKYSMNKRIRPIIHKDK